jgi:membrane-associated phospholipid phosphatase
MNKAALIVTLSLLCAAPAHATDYFETAGDIGQYAVPAAALGIALWQKDWTGCFQFAASYAATLAVSYGLKYTVKETRPNGLDDRSFPSGHTSSAFCGAAFLDIRYGPAYGIPAYGAASLVGWSRIESNMHYPLDVVAGAVIGIAGNLVFTRAKVKNVKVVPVADHGSYGAVVVYQW